MINKHVKLTEKQVNWLDNQDINASEMIRRLIDREIEKESDK